MPKEGVACVPTPTSKDQRRSGPWYEAESALPVLVWQATLEGCPEAEVSLGLRLGGWVPNETRTASPKREFEG